MNGKKVFLFHTKKEFHSRKDFLVIRAMGVRRECEKYGILKFCTWILSRSFLTPFLSLSTKNNNTFHTNDSRALVGYTYTHVRHRLEMRTNHEKYFIEKTRKDAQHRQQCCMHFI